MKVTFNYAVKDAVGETVGLFVQREHASCFCRDGETVSESTEIREFGDLAIARKNLEGDAALSSGETIGVW